MSPRKRKSSTEENDTFEDTPETEEKVSTKTEKKPVKPVQITPKRQPKKISFDVWAKRQGIRAHHKGGLRAHIQDPDLPRTMEEWDKAFSDY